MLGYSTSWNVTAHRKASGWCFSLLLLALLRLWDCARDLCQSAFRDDVHLAGCRIPRPHIVQLWVDAPARNSCNSKNKLVR